MKIVVLVKHVADPDSKWRYADDLTVSGVIDFGPLTVPKGDITLEDGTWLMLQARQGVYLQHSSQLDLSHAVTLYRDDGTTLVTSSASIDLKNGAAASSDPTHAEFAGPAHLVLNGSSP